MKLSTISLWLYDYWKVVPRGAPCGHFQKLNVSIEQFFSNLDLGIFSSFVSALFCGKI